ncbi:hypothetical protein GCM10008943_15530 [Paenochrobactrum glaciei]|uniref:Uncharacterized protein n=1 Tax=Paenochrobactrum glaciei TaxID=486407 RepID=A0ABP3R3P7_9HYPH
MPFANRQVSWLAGREDEAAFPVSQWLLVSLKNQLGNIPHRSTVAGSAAIKMLITSISRIPSSSINPT